MANKHVSHHDTTVVPMMGKRQAAVYFAYRATLISAPEGKTTIYCRQCVYILYVYIGL